MHVATSYLIYGLCCSSLSLRLHKQDIRTMNLSNVRAFRAALKVAVIHRELSTPFGTRTDHIEGEDSYLEVIALHGHLVLSKFYSHAIAVRIADALNDALHQWRVTCNIDPPFDVFGMTRGAQNSVTKYISRNMSLPTDALVLIALSCIQLHINRFDVKDVAPWRSNRSGYLFCSLFFLSSCS